MLETKKRILNLLKKRQMTVSELSRELNLTTATVSQHIGELQKMGAVERIDNEHFKKLKYYKATQASISPLIAKYVIGAAVVIMLASVFYLYRVGTAGATSTIPTQGAGGNTVNVSGSIPGAAAVQGACPMLYYSINGSVSNASGFKEYTIRASNGDYTDYVLNSNSTGSLYAAESISNVLSEPSGFSTSKQHYAFLTKVGAGFNTSAPGINMDITPQNFTISNNIRTNLTVTISANRTAQQGTYWLRIDGPCGGGVTPVLVTIGNRAYNGSVSPGVVPFA